MSLLDTIKGAREEAENAGTLPGTSKKDDTAASTSANEADKPRSGTRRSSAASAKPARDRAGSVRSASEASKKSKDKMTSEEKRAARNERRQEQDIVYDAKKATLESMPEYRHTQHIWWGMLIGGIALTLISYFLIRTAGEDDASGNIAMLSVAMMAAAYVLVIGAFIYDLVKVRPLRNKADQQLTGMSKKRMIKLVEEEERRKAEEKANAKK